MRNIFERLDKNSDQKLSKDEFLHIFEETERMLKLKVADDENNIKLLNQSLRDTKEMLGEIDENYRENHNSPEMKLKCSLGKVTMQVQSLTEEVKVNYMIGYDNRSMQVKGVQKDSE